MSDHREIQKTVEAAQFLLLVRKIQNIDYIFSFVRNWLKCKLWQCVVIFPSPHHLSSVTVTTGQALASPVNKQMLTLDGNACTWLWSIQYTAGSLCLCEHFVCFAYSYYHSWHCWITQGVLLTSVMHRLHEFIALCIVMYLLNCFIHCYVLYM